MVAQAVLLQLHLPVGRVLGRGRSGGLGNAGHGVSLDRGPVGPLYGTQPSSYPPLVGGDGLAVAPAVGALRQGLTVSFNLADVGFSLAGVGYDGVHGDIGGCVVKDQGDRLVLGITAGQGDSLQVSGLLLSLLLRTTLPLLTRSLSPPSMASARSIWSQVRPKFSLIGPKSAPRPTQYSMSLAACGWSE